jgi:hypothetical protein
MADERRASDVTGGCTQRVYLYLERDVDLAGPPYADSDLDLMAFDPDEVTAVVGLQPTTAWRRGDPVSATLVSRRFSRWQYELPPVDTFITEDVVIRLLEAIEPYAEGIAAACGRLGMMAGVMVVISTRGECGVDGAVVVSTPAIGYTAHTMQRLARLGLAVHHDQYVTLPEP